jgi:hypothetical protein
MVLEGTPPLIRSSTMARTSSNSEAADVFEREIAKAKARIQHLQAEKLRRERWAGTEMEGRGRVKRETTKERAGMGVNATTNKRARSE